MANGLRKRDFAGHFLANQDVARVEIGMEEVVHKQHVQETQNAQMSNLTVVFRWSIQQLRQRNALLKGLN